MVESLPAWIVARVLVVATLALAHAIVATVRPDNAGARLHVQQGLLTWDGGWYQSIATHGYAASGLQAVRFFPAFPMAGRALAWLPGVSPGVALVVLSNLCSLAAMATLVLLVRSDFGSGSRHVPVSAPGAAPGSALGPAPGPDLAHRSVWLLALAPAAYSLVLGYADGPLLLCSVAALYGARTGRWWWTALAGLVGGLVRPVGILLVVPVAVELWRQRRTETTPAGWAGRVAALIGPLVGTGSYMAWVDGQFGDPWLPFRLQQQLGHRGAVTWPLPAMWHNLLAVAHGHHLGSAAHIPWVILSVVLVVLAFRRLPLSYGAFATAVLVVALASSNLDSYERYALGAFPLVVAASTWTGRRSVEFVVLGLSALVMVGYAMLAFLGMVVP
ncbi:MAG: hypothetical protein ACRDYE_08110 [Acidimicrobiales bacterium]